MGNAGLSLGFMNSGFGFMQTQPCAELPRYPFVAGVIMVSINTLGMCQTVGKKVCYKWKYLRKTVKTR